MLLDADKNGSIETCQLTNESQKIGGSVFEYSNHQFLDAIYTIILWLRQLKVILLMVQRSC